MTKIVSCALFLVVAPALHAQLQFDVASVKENLSEGTGGTLFYLPSGGVRAVNIPAQSLVTVAYELKPYQVVGAPQWTREARYDIEAKPVGTATFEQSVGMFRALLSERFKLAFHRETRQLDGFALVRMRTDSLGPKLRVSTVTCRPPKPDEACKQGRIAMDEMKAVGVPLASLLQLVVNRVGAPVNDETGLDGQYDFELSWTNEVAPTDDRPSIYTALQEQLGLRLERRRGVPVEMFIVDRIERPAPD